MTYNFFLYRYRTATRNILQVFKIKIDYKIIFSRYRDMIEEGALMYVIAQQEGTGLRK